MWLAFVDESGDAKARDYFGICLALVNSAFYPEIKREAQRILLESGWDSRIEFKGSYLFSSSKGCAAVSVEQRVEIAHQLLDLQIAKKNARMKFFYTACPTADVPSTYLSCLPRLLTKALTKADQKGDKDLVHLSCDERQDLSREQVKAVAEPVLADKGYLILENVVLERSNFESVGIMYADLVAYLSARIDVISNDSELFDHISEEQFTSSGALRKLRSSKDLIAKIKQLNQVEVPTQ